MLHYFDPATATQLRDCAKNVYEKKEKYSVSEMFSWKLKPVTDICKRWIDKKFKTRFREQDLFPKQRCRKENKLISKKINILFAIWTFALAIQPVHKMIRYPI